MHLLHIWRRNVPRLYIANSNDYPGKEESLFLGKAAETRSWTLTSIQFRDLERMWLYLHGMVLTNLTLLPVWCFSACVIFAQRNKVWYRERGCKSRRNREREIPKQFQLLEFTSYPCWKNNAGYSEAWVINIVPCIRHTAGPPYVFTCSKKLFHICHSGLLQKDGNTDELISVRSYFTAQSFLFMSSFLEGVSRSSPPTRN